MKVEEESSFVPNFIKSEKPPTGSRRLNDFPHDQNDLTLAAAWRFIEQEKDVLIYCVRRASVEVLGRLALTSIRQGVLKPFQDTNQRIRHAMSAGCEWLGADHPAVKCLRYGLALHHAGLPRPFLNEVERLLRSGDCPLVISSPTLAQGLNLSASVLLIPTIWRNRKIIPTMEFANVVGRAGRAFVDVEGLVLHIVWEPDRGRGDWAVRQWEELVERAKAPAIASGLLQLALKIFSHIASVIDTPLEEVIDYLTGHSGVWDFTDELAELESVTAIEWERDIASLDSAILALMEPETEPSRLDGELDMALIGSLFSRELARETEEVQRLLRGFLLARANQIWSQTGPRRRRGYHLAGVGLRTGRFLDANIEDLVEILLCAETAVISREAIAAADAVVKFARLVFQVPPFRSRGTLHPEWENELRGWIEGRPAAKVVSNRRYQRG